MPRTVYHYTLKLTIVRLVSDELAVDDDEEALRRGTYMHSLTHDADAVIAAEVVGKYPLVYP